MQLNLSNKIGLAFMDTVFESFNTGFVEKWVKKAFPYFTELSTDCGIGNFWRKSPCAKVLP